MKPAAALRSILDQTRQDISHAVRRLVRAPGFTLAAMTVLALGVGANAAIFAVIDAVLLRSGPYPEPDRLVLVAHVPPQETFRGMPRFPLSPGNYLDWEQRQRVFTKMAALQPGAMTLSGRGDPEQLLVGRVTASYFDVFGIPVVLGRGFRPEEAAPGGNTVLVLSHALWSSRFGGDRGVIGQTMVLDDIPFQIVGVADAAYDSQSALRAWIPAAWPPFLRADRSRHFLQVYARLAPGIEVSAADAALKRIAADLEREYPVDNKGWGATVLTLRDATTGDIRSTLLVILGAVTFVLLIACANVANLILVRAIAQRPETAIRLALGASPWRVARSVLVESALLGVGAGLLGLAIGSVGIRLLMVYAADRLPRAMQPQFGSNVFLFTMGISILAGVVAGLWPALRMGKVSLVETIKEGGDRGDSDSSGSTVRSVLVVAEIALSVVLLVGAGLMIRTIRELSAVDRGFDSRNIVLADVSLPAARYPRPEQRQVFYDSVLTRLRAAPGVESAAIALSIPVPTRRVPASRNWPVDVVGRPPVPVAEQPNVQGNVVSPDYFHAMGIRLLKGRLLTEADQLGTAPVAIVSESTVRMLWPNDDPLGQRLVLSFWGIVPMEVVGVVGDVLEDGPAGAESAGVYLAFAQHAVPNVTLVVRSHGSVPATLGSAMAGAVHAVDRDRPLVQMEPLDVAVARSLGGNRMTSVLLGTFAALAMVLAAVGIYSVLAYTVRRRTREIGIRMALGSDRAAVTRMIVKDALRPTFIGVAIGILGALGLRGVLASMIFGVSATDPLTFALVAGMFVGVALIASAVPAYWASRVDPVVTLRSE